METVLFNLGCLSCTGGPDPNDIIVRAVPNAREIAEFIDEEWTTFVAEFNVRARAISHALIAETAKPLARFLKV